MKREFLLALTLVLGLFATAACHKFENRIVKRDTGSVYERVLSSRKLRCAYVIYPPSCVKDPNTQALSGISIDALNLVGKKLGLKVDWTEEVGWGTMLEGLQANRYDIVATAVWPEFMRARIAAFSKALFYTPLFACVRYGDHRFDKDLVRANSPDIKIAIIDGGIGQVVSDEEFPQAKILSMTQMTDLSQNLLNVADRKADITFADPFTLFRYERSNPRTIANLSWQKPLRIFPDCWMFKRDELQFKAMIDAALDEIINSGQMDKVLRSYELDYGQVYRVAPPFREKG